MQKTTLYLLALGIVGYLSPVHVFAFAEVNAFELPAWIQHNNNKTMISDSSNLEIGDHVITGDSGRVELQLRSNTTLRLYPDSKILLDKKTLLNSAEIQPIINVQQGRVCVEYVSEQNKGKTVGLSIGNTIVNASSYRSFICLLRDNKVSSISLHGGSAQITHSINPDIIILSQSGSELKIQDDGSYELLNQTAGSSKPSRLDESFITKTGAGSESQVNELQSDYIYTVYLFSTRSEEKAKRINEKLQKAGHQSEIIAKGEGDSIRYRLAVTGFKSRQSAKQFANTIVGNHGITETWIGKDTQDN